MRGLSRLLRVLRHRDFRLLWLGQATSSVGDAIVVVALALFIVDLTGSATDLGSVLAAYRLPLVAFLLVGGVLADRLPRHRVVVATDVVRFTLHALLAILIVTGAVRIWHIAVIGMLFGTAEAFFRPAVRGLLPQTVPEAEIQEASAVTATTDNLADFAGPALATAIVLGVGPAAAFGLDALPFLVSAVRLIRVSPRERTEPAAGEPAAGLLRDVRAGFHEVRSRAWIWATLAAFCVALFFVLGPWYVLGPIVAREQYGNLAVYGVLSAVFGAGMVAGALVGIRWRPRYPMRQAMRFVLLLPLSVGLYASGLPLAVVGPAIAIGGVGVALFDVWWLTALAERVPPDKLSRVTSYDWMVSLALLPLGFVLAGPAGEALGAANVLLGGAAIACVAFAVGQLPRETRLLERLDDGPQPPVPITEAGPRPPAG